MSPRWKFQLRQGVIWGVIMTILLTVFDMFINDDWARWQSIVVRAVIFLLTGVFFVAYFSWKSKLKKEAAENL